MTELYGVQYQSTGNDMEFEILEKAYHGVIVKINDLRFTDEATGTLSFDYELVSGEVSPSQKLDFEITVGNMIHDICVKAYQSTL